MNWADCSVCGNTRQVRSDGLVFLHHYNRVPCGGSYLPPKPPRNPVLVIDPPNST